MSILGAIGGIADTILSFGSANKANKLQEDAAKHGVSWRVADAKKAGVHPLAALGMPSISMSPIAVGSSGLGEAGQSLDRAVAAGSTKSQRQNYVADRITDLQLEGAALDNDIKRAELASLVRRTMGPAGGAALIPNPEPNTARGADIGGQTVDLGLGEWTTSTLPTAEEIERQYGDIAQEAYGAGRFALDAFRNIDWRRAFSELFGINPAH